MVKLGLELIIDSSFKIDRNGLTVTHYIWSQRAELNRRPTDYESVALPVNCWVDSILRMVLFPQSKP